MSGKGKKLKLLIAEPKDFSTEAIGLLEDFFEVTCREISQDEIGVALRDFDAVWIRLGLTIREKDISAGVRCRYIISATTGLNHLDLEELNKKGVNVLSLKGQTDFLSTITATAEHTIALILSLVRRIPAAHNSVLGGIWDRDLFKGYELSGKRVGIVGYGRLGRIVASYCLAFSMCVDIYDPNETTVDRRINRVESLEDIFSVADILTLHIPLDPTTRGLIDRNLLRRMKPSSYLINTSRGEIIVEQDLLMALEERELAGAALDVICDEEFFSPDNPLVQFAKYHENLVLTPHIGGCTWDSMEKCEVFMATRLREKVGV